MFEVVRRYETQERHVYVSVEKEDSRFSMASYGNPDFKPARSNFELYDGEYINLTYMNSVWLTWAINTKTLGNWRIAGKAIDYSYAIRYLNKALDFVREREKEETELIGTEDKSIIESDKEWPLRLTEFKLDAGVRTITPYQAARFVKWYRASYVNPVT